MIDIKTHPIWKNISPLKKRAHLLRIGIARQYAKLLPQEKFIAITGSVGKTMTTQAASCVLSAKYRVLTSTPNLDTILNLPITILKVRPSTDKVVLELGVEYRGEMDHYLTLIRPQTAIITRFSPAHSEFLGSLEEIAQEKSKLVTQLDPGGVAILNWDDPNVRALKDRTRARVIYYGTDSQNCHIWADNIQIKDFHTSFGLHFGVERLEINSKLLGKHAVYPLLAAAALGLENNIPFTKIKKSLEQVTPPPHRLQVIPGFNGSFILDDTYNSSPAALYEALDTLNLVPARRRILVLGEMRELGPYSEKYHRQAATHIFKDKPDLVLLGQGDTKYIADELLKLGFMPDRMEPNMKSADIISTLLKILAKGDVCLVKASRNVRFDEIIDRIIENTA